MTTSPVRIESGQWAATFRELSTRGLTWFDFLAVIDRGEQLEIVARVVNSHTNESACHSTLVDGSVESLSTIYLGATWYEREAQEMFGVTFVGLSDTRPLLFREFPAPSPMRKAVQ